MRLFTAIKLSPEALQLAVDTQRLLQGKLTCKSWQSKQTLHLTLHFLGEVPDEQIQGIHSVIKECVQKAVPFRLETATIGVFPNPNRPRVVWLGIAGDVIKLASLQSQLAPGLRQFGYQEQQGYTPHITLARSPQGPLDLTQLNAAISHLSPVLWEVDRLYLLESQLRPGGTVYTVVDEYPLSS